MLFAYYFFYNSHPLRQREEINTSIFSLNNEKIQILKTLEGLFSLDFT